MPKRVPGTGIFPAACLSFHCQRPNIGLGEVLFSLGAGFSLEQCTKPGNWQRQAERRHLGARSGEARYPYQGEQVDTRSPYSVWREWEFLCDLFFQCKKGLSS